MPLALIASAGTTANEYLARHITELGYPRPVIVASGGEARRRLNEKDFEVVVINTPLPDEFGHELGAYAVEKATLAYCCWQKAAPLSIWLPVYSSRGFWFWQSRFPAYSSGRRYRLQPAAIIGWP